MTENTLDITTMQTVTPHPIVAALVAAEQILGPNRTWYSENPLAKKFLDKVFKETRNETNLIPELVSKVSRDYQKLNAFLRERKFEIQLEPFQTPDFGVVSILELLLEWQVKGSETVLRHDGKDYPAVEMRSESFGIFPITGNKSPGVAIRTKTDDTVLLTLNAGLLDSVKGDVAEAGLHIVRSATTVRPAVTSQLDHESFTHVVFPMVDLNVRPDISWLIGTKTVGDDGLPGVIAQALQQTQFSMDHLGALVKSAVAIAVSRGISQKKILYIDQPFLVVVHRPSLSQPIFTGYITQQHWKKPNRPTE
jgi:hypothetical protein